MYRLPCMDSGQKRQTESFSVRRVWGWVLIEAWTSPVGAQFCASVTNWHLWISLFIALFENLIGQFNIIEKFTHPDSTGTLVLKRKKRHSLASSWLRMAISSAAETVKLFLRWSVHVYSRFVYIFVFLKFFFIATVKEILLLVLDLCFFSLICKMLYIVWPVWPNCAPTNIFLPPVITGVNHWKLHLF